MKLPFFIIVAVFAIMGAFALLEWRTERGKADSNVSLPRRSFLSLMVALVGGLLIGSYSWQRNRESRQELEQLFELELLLAQLDGLVSAALAQGDVAKLLPLLKTWVNKIGEYGSKATRVMTELRDRLSDNDYEDLQRGASMIAYGLDQIENPTPRDLQDANNNPLITMQKGIALARTKTRELIDVRVSSF